MHSELLMFISTAGPSPFRQFFLISGFIFHLDDQDCVFYHQLK